MIDCMENKVKLAFVLKKNNALVKNYRLFLKNHDFYNSGEFASSAVTIRHNYKELLCLKLILVPMLF